MTETQTGIRVLLVDDETDFLESTAKALRRRGFETTTASGGKAALEFARSRRFDVAFLDVKMPGMDGHQLFYALHDALPEMRIVMLTGHGDLQKAFELGKNGLFTYLAKPVETDDLVRTLMRAYEQGDRVRSDLREDEMESGEALPVRVLLVDDENEFLLSAKKIFQRRGMDVFEASNGQEALDLLARQRVDVVVADVKMPGLGGIDLLDRIKRDDPLIEVVLLTGHGSVTLAVDGMKRGAFDYLTKPQETEDLIRVIRAACGKKREAEAMRRRARIEKLLEKNPS